MTKSVDRVINLETKLYLRTRISNCREHCWRHAPIKSPTCPCGTATWYHHIFARANLLKHDKFTR
ncbi:hypothetical protein BDQ12DRAFT_687212 [Crucibulum laeve]|uniref:Uncharacterized protein n=1 Tax=Crucibulum laeve TaxID=68775 RepID=A0A5C3LW28_9AGAR|nr:hypothetical protein BDQ12DRAFT_687212 [Crucibulum laeve]